MLFIETGKSFAPVNFWKTLTQFSSLIPMSLPLKELSWSSQAPVFPSLCSYSFLVHAFSLTVWFWTSQNQTLYHIYLCAQCLAHGGRFKYFGQINENILIKRCPIPVGLSIRDKNKEDTTVQAIWALTTRSMKLWWRQKEDMGWKACCLGTPIANKMEKNFWKKNAHDFLIEQRYSILL